MTRIGSRVPSARRSSAWLPNQFYAAGELVVYQETAYTALADFTSAGSFNAANWQIVSPGAEIFYSANATGTPLALATTAPPGAGTSLLCSGLVPQTFRPVMLYGEAFVDVTTAPAAGGTGTATLLVYDDQGTPVFADGGDVVSFEGGSGTAGVAKAIFWARIPPSTPSRTYTLYCNRGGDGTFRANIMNGQNSSAFRSLLTAVYR